MGLSKVFCDCREMPPRIDHETNGQSTAITRVIRHNVTIRTGDPELVAFRRVPLNLFSIIDVLFVTVNRDRYLLVGM